jgi:AraC family transcriptional regulator
MNNYQKSIDKVLTHIDANLNEKQELDKLAEIANLSKFHFHRIMKAFLDETLGNYINRNRLETAVKLLRYSSQPINEIANQVGYDTLSAFNKGFKKMFRVSPTSIRKHKNLIIDPQKTTVMKKFQLVETVKQIQDILVVFQQSKGNIGDHATKANWESLFAKAQKFEILNFESKFYGINGDDPEITSNEKVRYDACIFIQKSKGLEANFSTKTIFGGKYLCFLYKGDYQNLGLVYNHIFRDWIIKMDYELRDEPIFEQYINNKEVTPKEDLLTEIFIPIN